MQSTASPSCAVSIHLKPGARRDGITGMRAGALCVSVTSPPLDGRANAHLLRFVATRLGIAKSGCTLLRGEKARDKVIKIEGLTREKAMMLLTSDEKKVREQSAGKRQRGLRSQ